MTEAPLFAPPGHFYSPIPSALDVAAHEEALLGTLPRSLQGVDICESEQISMLQRLAGYYRDMPYQPIARIESELAALKSDYLGSSDDMARQAILKRYDSLIRENRDIGFRYLLENPNYGYTDGIVSYCMIRHVKPRRILEIGSGYSSCLILDVNEMHFDNRIKCIFVEPHPELLFSLVREEERNRLNVLQIKVQDIDMDLIADLGERDVVFIDSSHVSKLRSDVNFIFFEILPRLNSGVYVHFHDIFYPFEYPLEWLREGRAWNEAYLLRAFLTYNDVFRIVFFTSFMQALHEKLFEEYMPLAARDKGGSIWIQRR